VGRARSQTHAIADPFAATFGTTRGSKAAQAQRDLAETQRREHFLLTEGESFRRQCWALDKDPRPVNVLIKSLFSAWKNESTQVLAAEESERLQSELSKYAKHPDVGDPARARARFGTLAKVARVGDPPNMSGLTFPVTQALSAYFCNNIENWDYDDVLAGLVIDNVLEGAHEKHYYVRLQPLFEGLATTLRRGSRTSLAAATAAAAMATVPLELALELFEGPLRSWVEAFVEREHQERLSGRERAKLQMSLSPIPPRSDRVSSPLKELLEIIYRDDAKLAPVSE